MHSTSTGSILIAILAAGAGQRFGGNKLAALCAGKPLGRWSLDAALALGHRVVWIGSEASAGLTGGLCERVVNPDPSQGLGKSLSLAAETAIELGAQALLILLADMPLISLDLLESLISAGAPSACRYPNGRPGVPALFPASTFDQLRGLAGERGGAGLLQDLDGLVLVELPARDLLDVDRPEDLRIAARILEGAMPHTPPPIN